jgi:AraC-like DNA-binding protein
MSRSRRPSIRALSWDYPSGHRVVPHRHRAAQLVFASAGVMTVETPAGSWIVPPHRAVWVPAGTRHAIRMSGAVAMRTLYVPAALARPLPRSCGVLEVTPLVRELVLAAVARGGLDPATRADARLFHVLVDELRSLPTRAFHLPFPRDSRARRVADALARDPVAAARPARELARGSGASPRTLERVFRSETGMSFGTWRQQLRLGRALEQLATGDAVTTVAFDAGYAGVSAFVAAFKATFGRTPGRYFRTEPASRRSPRAGTRAARGRVDDEARALSADAGARRAPR